MRHDSHNIVRVRELPDDSISIDGGRVFKPQIDLERSLELLKSFNAVVDRRRRPIYKAWQYADYYLLPAFQQYLMWGFFVPLVKHHHFWTEIRSRNIRLEDRDYYSFGSLTRLLTTLRYQPRRKMDHYIFAAVSHMILPTVTPSVPILFCDDYADGDWRYSTLKHTLRQIPLQFACSRELGRGSWGLIPKEGFFFHGHGYWGGYKYESPDIDFSRLEDLLVYLSEWELKSLICFLTARFSEIVSDCNYVLSIFKRWRPKMILAYDQLERNLSVVLAAKIANIPVVSYQHGAANRYATGVISPGIPTEVCNLKSDKLILWGNYWKDRLTSYSNKYLENDLVVGCHHSKRLVYRPQPLRVGKPVRILMPFEFLPFPEEVIEYIDLFAKRNWNVVIKLRPAFPDSARAAYAGVPSSHVQFVEDITEDQIVNDFDAIAGAQSTFLYETSGLGRPIWYLRTSFKMIESIVTDGIAHELTPEMLRETSNLNWLFQPKCTQETFLSLFAQQSQTDVVKSVFEQCCA